MRIMVQLTALKIARDSMGMQCYTTTYVRTEAGLAFRALSALYGHTAWHLLCATNYTSGGHSRFRIETSRQFLYTISWLGGSARVLNFLNLGV